MVTQVSELIELVNIYNEENLTPLTIQSSFIKKQRASIDTCLLIHATSYGPTLQKQVGWFKLREVACRQAEETCSA